MANEQELKREIQHLISYYRHEHFYLDIERSIELAIKSPFILKHAHPYAMKNAGWIQIEKYNELLDAISELHKKFK